MSAAVRVAVLGCGYGARVALPVYHRLTEFDPVAVWSRRGERARAVAAREGLPLGSDRLDEVLSLPGLEAVHVAVPVALHEEFALAAIARGLHVLCEKPLAGDLASARRIAAAASEAGVLAAVNLSRRFQAPRARVIELARELLGRPRFASISLVHSDHASPASRPYSWAHDAGLGGGRLQAYGVHDLDLLLAVLGPIHTVAAATEVQVPERPDAAGTPRTVSAEDAYAALLRPASGGLACLWLAATAQHRRGDQAEFYGEGGTVRLDGEGRVWSARAGEELRCEGPLESDSAAAFAQAARRFHAAIRFGAEPDPSLLDGLRVQALIDALRAAASRRAWVEVEQIERGPAALDAA